MAVEGPSECWKSVQSWRAAPVDLLPANRRPEPHVVELLDAVADDQTDERSVNVEVMEVIRLRTGTDDGGAD